MKTNKIPVTDFGLTAALLTQGCELIKDNPYIKLITDHGSTLTFHFEENDRVKRLIGIWEDPQVDPDHPIAHMRIFNMNRIGLAKEAKEAVGLVEIKKNGKIVLISTNASEDQKAKLLSRL